MNNKINIKDKTFEVSISDTEIASIVKTIANNIISDTLQVYINEGQDINIKYLENVSEFAKFASTHYRDLYESSILKRKGKEYNEVSDNIREKINKGNLSKEEREKLIEDTKDDLVNILETICSEKVGNVKRKSKRLSGNKI